MQWNKYDGAETDFFFIEVYMLEFLSFSDDHNHLNVYATLTYYWN